MRNTSHLSERLKRIVQQKRNGTLAGLALLKELEELAKETVSLFRNPATTDRKFAKP